MIPVALTIAGSDSGGCAGIQADLKTFSALGVFGTSAITCLTAQNTRGVQAVHPVSPDMVLAQIEAVLSDFQVKAIKTGMLYSADIIAAVAQGLLARRGDIPVIIDPVMIATSGDRLIDAAATDDLVRKLFPLAALITPNLDEAATLTGSKKASATEDMVAQGRALLAMGAAAVLMKGGHGEGSEAIDILVTPEGIHTFSAPRLETRNTHGTGCTLSAAIAAGLAHGLALPEAVAKAKRYLSGSLAAGASWRLGHGPGPVDHFHALRMELSGP